MVTIIVLPDICFQELSIYFGSDNMYYIAFLFISQKYLLSFCFYNNYKISSHIFKNKVLHSDMSILEIVTQINTLLPQFANFINQFNNTIIESGVNVVTDSTGNMSIDVPNNMGDEEANKISTRIGILDRLITTRSQELNDLLQKGIFLEEKLKMENSNYVSQLADKAQEIRRLNGLYKH
jgi:hypothetical protein